MQVISANKRAPLAKRKQMKEDGEGAAAEEDQPPPKKKKLDELLVAGDKQKALRTVALGNLSSDTLEQGLELAASVGKASCTTAIQYCRLVHCS